MPGRSAWHCTKTQPKSFHTPKSSWELLPEIPHPKELMGAAARDSTSQRAHGNCCQRYTLLNWGLLESTEGTLSALAYRKGTLHEALKKDNEAAHQVPSFAARGHKKSIKVLSGEWEK